VNVLGIPIENVRCRVCGAPAPYFRVFAVEVKDLDAMPQEVVAAIIEFRCLEHMVSLEEVKAYDKSYFPASRVN